MYEMNEIVGNSPWVCEIQKSIALAAACDDTVPILGPSGTGKELIAQGIHAGSRRRERRLVVIDCATLLAGLSASQLFGHVKGAFSGACRDAPGSFLAAHGGTIFLDELGELLPELQAQLLRVIEQRTVTPVGGYDAIPVDVRIIAATNRDLRREVAAGRFREDLYYRLKVLTLTTTPLSGRPEDIPPLCRRFLERRSLNNKLPVKRPSPEALELLMSYPWPGNVRELQNVLVRATIFSDGEQISADQMRAALEAEDGAAIAGRIGIFDDQLPPVDRCQDCAPDGLMLGILGRGPLPTLAEFESRLIRATLEETSYNISAAARQLGIERHQLLRKVRKFGISAPRRLARTA